MTVAEKKVRELASKLAEQIEECEKNCTAPDMILHGVKCYLSGIEDGISLSEEMRELVEDGPKEAISGGPKTTIGTVDPKITTHLEIDERDLPWNIGRGECL